MAHKYTTERTGETKPCARPGCTNLCHRTEWDSDARWAARKYCNMTCVRLARPSHHKKGKDEARIQKLERLQVQAHEVLQKLGRDLDKG
jgi:hypothetical protein